MSTTMDPDLDRGAAAPRGTRRITSTAADLATHERRFGALQLPADRGAVLAALEASGLRGRGGAAFPTFRKAGTAAARSQAAGGAVVIANAAEGEPASSKDAALLTRAPHLVLDGLAAMAHAVGATRAYLYTGRVGARAVAPALAERLAARRDRLPVQVVLAPDTFVSGEESAVIAAVTGRSAVPSFKRHIPAVRGAFGLPTVVQNAETLAQVALIGRFGPQWFRSVGTAEDPGTFLATVSGSVHQPGVVEAAYGETLAQLLTRAGGPAHELLAVLVGGYHGAWVPAQRLEQTTMSRSGLGPHGASPGAGVLIALDSGSCGLRATADITAYLAGQSARQCGPCMFGLPALAESLAQLARPDRLGYTDTIAGTVNHAVRDTTALAGLVEGRGACHHPDGTVRLVRSALQVFAADVVAHRSGRCLADEAAQDDQRDSRSER